MGTHPKVLKAGTETDIYTSIFIVELFVVAKKWKQHKCPSMDEQIKCNMYMQWNVTQF